MFGILLRFVSAKLSGLRERRRREWIDRLCARGMRLGNNVVVMHDVSFDSTYPWLIEVEDGCRISTGVRILAHDATPLRDIGVSRLGRVRILQDSFIAERCIILPGVTIGPRAMIAAGSVVSRDVGEGMLAAGNPARIYGRYDEYLSRTAAAAIDAHRENVADLANPTTIARVKASMDRGEAVFVTGVDSDTAYFYNVTPDELRRSSLTALERMLEAHATSASSYHQPPATPHNDQ